MSASSQFLALVLSDTFLATAVWQREGETITITAQSSCLPLADQNEATITSTLDRALNELGEVALDISPIMLCLPNSWVNETGLVLAKKRYLKQLTQDLKLQPMGFIVSSDAIAAREKEQHQTPLDGCLLYSNPHQLLAEIYQSGQVTSQETIGRSSHIDTDVQELVARLPPKINLVVYIPQPGEEYSALVEILQQQFPQQLAVLTAEELVTAAITMGGKVMTVPDKKTPAAATATTAPGTMSLPTTESNKVGDFHAPSFLAALPPATPSPTIPITSPAVLSTNITTDQLDLASATPAPVRQRPPLLLFVRHFLRKLRKKTTINPEDSTINDRLVSPRRRSRLLIILPIFLLLLIIGSTLAYWQLSRSYTAHVTVVLQSTPLEKSVSFWLDTTGSQTNSATMSAVVATAISETATLDKEVPTTGVKIIGDKAQGKVTIFNRTSQSKTFPANTKLALGKLSFVTNDSVTVASASTQVGSDYSSTTAPGSADVSITASQIGPESNLDKNKEFAIANFDTSSYVAKNTDAFSGGSSREIQAVSAKDIDSAVSELLAAATSQLKDKLLSQANEITFIFPANNAVVKSKTSSEAVGNEAKFTQVSLTAEMSGFRVDSSAIVAIAPTLYGSDIPSNQALENISVKLANPTTSVSGAHTIVSGTLTARAVGQVDAEKLLQDITHQYAARAQTIIEQAAPTTNVSITIRPSWVRWLFPRLPAQPDRINLNISSGQ